jgi:TP901 family phage tail tape measure protein
MEIFSVMASMSLIDMITAPLRSIGAQMNVTNKAAASLSSGALALAKSLLPIALVAGVVLGGLGAMVLSTVETQKALGELGSVGITQFGAMEEAATDFSNTFSGTTKSDFLYAAYDIKSGISSLSDEGIAGFTGLSALTAKATKATVGQMTSLFATGYGIYKGYYSQMTDMQFGEMFSAGISASVQAFKTDGSKMSQAISTLGATATNSNIPLQEQLAILGVLQATMPGAEAGTKYKAFLNAAGAAGGKLGLDFLDANNQLKSTPEILEAMRAQFGPTIDAMEKMQIKKAFGTDEAVAFIDLLYTKTGDLKGGIQSVGGAMVQGQEFTNDMAQHMNNDLGASMALVGQQFHNLCEIVGSVFAPAVGTVTGALSCLILMLQKLAASPVGKFLLVVIAVLSVTIITVTLLSGAVWAGAAAWAAFNTMILANPIGIIVLAVVGLVAVLIALYNNFDSVREVVDAFIGWISRCYNAIKTFVSFWHDIDLNAALWISFPELYASISDFWDGLTSLFDIDLSESGRKLIMTLASGIKSVITAPYDLVKAGLSKVRQLLPFSDAQEGPLSSLTLSGTKIMDTLGSGIRAAAPNLHATASAALAGVALAANLAVTPPAISSPQGPTPIQMHTPAPDRATVSPSGNSVTIQHLTVQLPGVEDVEGFVAALQQLVAQHDGSGNKGEFA